MPHKAGEKMNTIRNYLKTHGIETILILALALIAIWPSIQPTQTSLALPSNIEPLSYSYPSSWSNGTIVRTVVDRCSHSWFGSSWYSGDRPIVKKIGSGAYAISYQKGIWVEMQKGSGSIFDIIYFRSTSKPGVWELKSFQYISDPLLRRMAESEIKDVPHTAYAQAIVTRNGDEKTVDLYCFPGK